MLTCLSLNLTRKHHPKIWGAQGLPSGGYRFCWSRLHTGTLGHGQRWCLASASASKRTPSRCATGADAYRLSAVPCGGVLVLCQHLVLHYRQASCSAQCHAVVPRWASKGGMSGCSAGSLHICQCYTGCGMARCHRGCRTQRSYLASALSLWYQGLWLCTHSNSPLACRALHLQGHQTGVVLHPSVLPPAAPPPPLAFDPRAMAEAGGPGPAAAAYAKRHAMDVQPVSPSQRCTRCVCCSLPLAGWRWGCVEDAMRWAQLAEHPLLPPQPPPH